MGRVCAAGVLLLAGTGCVDYGVSTAGDTAAEPVFVVETFVQSAAPAVDVLWVIDDTGSMAAEQRALASSFPAFVQALTAQRIAYQLGVVVASVEGADAGRLRGNPWIITPEADDPAAAFTRAVEVGTSGTSAEAGLGAVVLALAEPLRSGANRGFRRPGAALHVVVVSDADDASDATLGADPATAFLEAMAAEAVADGAEVRFSAVAGDVPDGCTGTSGQAVAAVRYAQVVEALDGVFASICQADLGRVSGALGETSLVFPTAFALQAPAMPESISVVVDAVRQLGGWTYLADPPSVVFDVAPAADATVEVRYQVAEDTEGGP